MKNKKVNQQELRIDITGLSFKETTSLINLIALMFNKICDISWETDYDYVGYKFTDDDKKKYNLNDSIELWKNHVLGTVVRDNMGGYNYEERSLFRAFERDEDNSAILLHLTDLLRWWGNNDMEIDRFLEHLRETEKFDVK